MVKTKKKRPADIPTIISLIEQAGVSVNRIEKDLKISKSTILRGIKPDTKYPLPVHWETPILKYLRKKIADKEDAEKETTEILQELGFKQPEKQNDLIEEEKVIKTNWFEKIITE